jgi:hypothetical protein
MFGENHTKNNDALMDEKIQKYKKNTFKQKLYPNYRRHHKNQHNSNNINQINRRQGDQCANKMKGL